LYSFVLRVRDPQAPPNAISTMIEFQFGFALLSGNDLLQDHLRRMGLGRSALLVLLQHLRGVQRTLDAKPRPLTGTDEDLSEEHCRRLKELFASVRAEAA
jgi:hypothetical protein